MVYINIILIIILLYILLTKYMFFLNENFTYKYSGNYLADPRNKLYRLGDMIRGYFDNHPEILDYYKINYQNSIATIYKIRLDAENKDIRFSSNLNLNYPNLSYHILIDILESKIKNSSAIDSYIIPTPDSLVIHLRTGDIIDNTSYDINDILSGKINKHPNTNNYYDNNCKNYVKSLNYYRSLSKYYHNFNKVVIVSGFNSNSNHNKSINYINKIKQYFESLNKNVILRLNHEADEDFIFMCYSKFFISSGGGFSSIIADIVKLKLGTVLK